MSNLTVVIHMCRWNSVVRVQTQQLTRTKSAQEQNITRVSLLTLSARFVALGSQLNAFIP